MICISRFRLALLVLAALACSSLAAVTASGEPLPLPEGRPILTIRGAITHTNTSGRAEFDLRMLESMGLVTVVTATPWFPGKVRFEGVGLAALMERVGARGDRILATALNDYSSELSIQDARRTGAILAIKRNGEYMPVRDKGPLFIVFPYDSSPALQNELYYSRSVWQLREMTVK